MIQRRKKESANLFFSDALLIRIKEEVRRLQRRHQLKNPTTSDLSDDDNPNDSRSSSVNQQQPLLTLKQVNIICARLLKERDEQIREEYDRVLSTKLNGKQQSFFFYVLTKFSFFLLEQYEGFVRFTQDQLTRRFSELQFSCTFTSSKKNFSHPLSSLFFRCVMIFLAFSCIYSHPYRHILVLVNQLLNPFVYITIIFFIFYQKKTFSSSSSFVCYYLCIILLYVFLFMSFPSSSKVVRSFCADKQRNYQ